MQLTKFTDYALRVLIYLAQHPDGLATISDIAKDYDIPATHLMKVVHRLAQRGYIVTVRGKGGGMRLAKAPDMINVDDLVRDTEDNIDIVECFNAATQSPEAPGRRSTPTTHAGYRPRRSLIAHRQCRTEPI